MVHAVGAHTNPKRKRGSQPVPFSVRFRAFRGHASAFCLLPSPFFCHLPPFQFPSTIIHDPSTIRLPLSVHSVVTLRPSSCFLLPVCLLSSVFRLVLRFSGFLQDFSGSPSFPLNDSARSTHDWETPTVRSRADWLNASYRLGRDGDDWSTEKLLRWASNRRFVAKQRIQPPFPTHFCFVSFTLTSTFHSMYWHRLTISLRRIRSAWVGTDPRASAYQSR
jgi:hypothetical protein